MKLSEEEYKLLREIQQNEKHKKNYVKVTVLLMLHLGESLEKISIFLGISTQTVKLYSQTYQEKGLDYYLENHYLGYSGKLTVEQKEILKEELNTNLYATSQEIADFIFSKFGIRYTSTGLVPLLHRLGFSYKKTKLVPCEVDIEAQKTFVQALEVLVEEAKKEGDVVYFADGVHPQHNTKSAYAWIEKGKEKEILSVSGRSRVNINAVMNAENPCEVVMVESKSVDAESTLTLYKKLEALHPEAKNIYVICDNARYYKNKLLNESLKNSKIKQVFLPAYSPNLNLIERLWKFMRKKVINHHFYRKFDDFKKAIFDFFENIKDFEAELQTLMSWNFHIPENKPINL
jgi:transposase